MKNRWFVLYGFFLFVIVTQLTAQVEVGDRPEKGAFPLSANKTVKIHVEETDFEVVRKSAGLFANDIRYVTGKKTEVLLNKPLKEKEIMIAGTIGYNKWIDSLIETNKLDVSRISGGWEQFVIKTIDNPFPGIDKALVIAGSDRRGTAFGIFTLSEAIGVSPWYWWADGSIKKQNGLYVKPVEYYSPEPSVKYRGIFINDEDWGLHPWSAKNYEKELGDIGPETYAAVCELLLRLKANLLAPAMHSCSGAFNKYEENKVVADSYGIIMTSAHCEPLLFNNASEWDKTTMGKWNYKTNKEGINKVLDKRVSENAPYENIYTIAMRGIHDEGILGIPKEEQVEMLTEVISDQRTILKRYIDKPIEDVPQIFVPYKEVLDIYEKGLPVLDDITIVWPDDNFGYIKKLSNPEEQKRKGGSGIYYHISYLGEPHDYLWLNTTSPALMYAEMHKAWLTKADRYWLLNVGDIKPGELGMQLFLDMAYDMTQFNFTNINDHHVDFLVTVFGEEYRTDIRDILDSYFHLGFQRKPETMGWGWEWNRMGIETLLLDTEFSFRNYGEAEKCLGEYDRISAKALNILDKLPEEYKPAFFELVYYPVKGASLMNKKMLAAQKNRWYAVQGRSAGGI